MGKLKFCDPLRGEVNFGKSLFWCLSLNLKQGNSEWHSFYIYLIKICLCSMSFHSLFIFFPFIFPGVAPARMAMPMNSLPLLMDFTEEDSKTSKTPLTVSLCPLVHVMSVSSWPYLKMTKSIYISSELFDSLSPTRNCRTPLLSVWRNSWWTSCR